MKVMFRKRLTYGIGELVPYINWAYFHFAWQVKDAAEQARLKREAMEVLGSLDGRYAVSALFALGDAVSDGDDIVYEGTRIPMLRQQRPESGSGPCYCLADFIRPASHGQVDHMGIFATAVDARMETDFEGDDYLRMMVQLLADRLAEAAAEKMHEQVRRHYWGYAPGERLSVEELHAERFCGIRPAVGYPSLPDASINFILSGILGFGEIGIRLTESGAMKPHASVSGLMLAHPAARYFSVGAIGDDQLRDYSRRRGVPVAVIRRFLTSNV